ncbi:hypothetical protein SteCoe_365 [Stentor coeruleus]|uniref:Cyclic nucleotide-binding domain-containing protein n=1 Tax=Stentor coeruleus TaxID=5963 RepID=A0A1R2D4J0_9CILI|nr:hypothetical protein SteCoe_365 [Stentor coeruleus]
MKLGDKIHYTEDLTSREINDKGNDIDLQVILGITIDPEPYEKVLLKKGEHEEQNACIFGALRDIKSTAIYSVRSICHRLIIRNNSIVKRYWDIIMELILAYNVITTLFFLAYEYPTGGMLITDIVCWVLFIIDIVLTFYTEQTDEKNNSIKNFVGIANLYIKGWLIFDLVAIIPLRSAGYEMAEYLLRMFRLLKLSGVIDITDGTGISYLLSYFNFGRREKSGKITYSYTSKIIASLIRLFITIIFTVYFMGCFWYWFQRIVSNYKYSSSKEGVDENTFENAFGLADMQSKDIALRSSYYMLTTIATIGYGDFMPRNVYEMSFAIVAMLFGVTLFAVIMGNFNSALTYYTEATSAVDCLGELNLWLDSLEIIHGKIDKKLRTNITDHFKYYFEKDRLKNLAKNYWEASTPENLISIDQQYVSSLPEEIYNQILQNLYSDFLQNFKYFFGSSKVKYAIIPHLQPRRYITNELILENDKEINELIFINSGSVSIGIILNGEHQTLLLCEDGRTIIGDYPILTKVKNRFDYLALRISEGFAIDSNTFYTILNIYFKDDRNNLLAIAAKRESNLKRLLNDYIKRSEFNLTSIIDVGKNFDIVIPKESGKGENMDETEVAKDLLELAENGKSVDFKTKNILNIVKNAGELRRKGYEKMFL